MALRPVGVLETREFMARAKRLFSDAERHALIDHVARNPTAGDLIEGTGRARKLRWATTGHGKRGGVRVIYYFHSGSHPILLFTVYGKSERADLTASERNDLKTVIAVIKRRLAERA